MLTKSQSLSISVFTSLLLSGCFHNSPKLYGNDSCGDGKTAYVYSSGNAAICLNEASVAYMICARELGVLSVDTSGLVKGNLSANVLNKAATHTGGEASNTVNVKYADEGPLAQATARAIDTCIDIHKNYR
jgi:hypothetical protein